MSRWSERPPEEQRLLNPSFCSLLLWHSARAHEDEAGETGAIEDVVAERERGRRAIQKVRPQNEGIRQAARVVMGDSDAILAGFAMPGAAALVMWFVLLTAAALALFARQDLSKE